MDSRIDDAGNNEAAQALGTEMVDDTGIPEPRCQRDECYMMLMKALHPTAKAKQPFTTVELENLTLRSGVPLLMLPNGWARVNELAQGQYGLGGEYTRSQRWTMRPEFNAVDPWDISERALGHQIDMVINNWDPDSFMDQNETAVFYKEIAGLQHEMVHRTLAERVGILGGQIDDDKKAKIEEVVEIIQTFLRAGVPDPFKVAKIQKAVVELRGNPFAMDAMKLLVEDMSAQANDEFAVNQLTAILGALDVASKAAGPEEIIAESDGSTGAGSGSGHGSDAGQIRMQGETLVLSFRGK